jgi:hypothetical protein
MDRTQLLTGIGDCLPVPGETVCLQRRGDQYDWSCLDPGLPLPAPSAGGGEPEAWLFFSGQWPHEPGGLAAHLDDLLSETESMCGRPDRCRWPLDQPYPRAH